MTTSPRTQGTQQLFEQLFQRTRRNAYHLAYRLTGNAADAEDVTQDAFVRAWNRFDGFDVNRSFEGWLFRIITNRVIDLQRRRKRRPMHSIDAPSQGEEGQALTHKFAVADSDPAQIILGAVREEQLQEALIALPDDYRQTLLLCAVEERSYQEIAETMQCAVGTVRSRIHRARSMLRRALESDRSLRKRPPCFERKAGDDLILRADGVQ